MLSFGILMTLHCPYFLLPFQLTHQDFIHICPSPYLNLTGLAPAVRCASQSACMTVWSAVHTNQQGQCTAHPYSLRCVCFEAVRSVPAGVDTG